MRRKLYGRWETTCMWLRDMLIARVKRVFFSRARPPLVPGKLACFVFVALLLSTHHAEASKLHSAGNLVRGIIRWWPDGSLPPTRIPGNLSDTVNTFSEGFDGVEAKLLTVFDSFNSTPLPRKDLQPLAKDVGCLYLEEALNEGKFPTASEVATTIRRHRAVRIIPGLSDVNLVKSTINGVVGGTLDLRNLDQLRFRAWVFQECTLK